MKRETLLHIIVAPIWLLPLLCVIGVFYSQISRYLQKDDWKTKTTPLPVETIELLCRNFEIREDNPLCNGKKDVYGPDFIDIISDTFRPYEAYNVPSSEAATYDEVDKKIGVFKYECESVVHQADGLSYFVCYYDLRGDKEFPIGIAFTHPEMATYRIGMRPLYNDD